MLKARRSNNIVCFGDPFKLDWMLNHQVKRLKLLESNVSPFVGRLKFDFYIDFSREFLRSINEIFLKWLLVGAPLLQCKHKKWHSQIKICSHFTTREHYREFPVMCQKKDIKNTQIKYKGNGISQIVHAFACDNREYKAKLLFSLQ